MVGRSGDGWWMRGTPHVFFYVFFPHDLSILLEALGLKMLRPCVPGHFGTTRGTPPPYPEHPSCHRNLISPSVPLTMENHGNHDDRLKTDNHSSADLTSKCQLSVALLLPQYLIIVHRLQVIIFWYLLCRFLSLTISTIWFSYHRWIVFLIFLSSELLNYHSFLRLPILTNHWCSMFLYMFLLYHHRSSWPCKIRLTSTMINYGQHIIQDNTYIQLHQKQVREIYYT